MGKDRKDLNPGDQFRKEQRKQELKKNKQRLTLVRSVQELLSDPNKIDEEIAACKKKQAENKLDKRHQERIKELQRMKEVAINKQKMNAALGRSTAPSSSSSSSSSSSAAAAAGSADPGVTSKKGPTGTAPSSQPQPQPQTQQPPQFQPPQPGMSMPIPMPHPSSVPQPGFLPPPPMSGGIMAIPGQGYFPPAMFQQGHFIPPPPPMMGGMQSMGRPMGVGPRGLPPPPMHGMMGGPRGPPMVGFLSYPSTLLSSTYISSYTPSNISSHTLSVPPPFEHHSFLILPSRFILSYFSVPFTCTHLDTYRYP